MGFNRDIVKENLLKICMDTQEVDRSERIGKVWFGKERFITLYDEDMICFNNALKGLLNDSFIENNVTTKFLEQELQKIIHETFGILRDDRDAYLNKWLVELKDSIEERMEEWVFIIPLENVSLHNEPFEVGNVKLYTFNENKAEEFMSTATALLNRDLYEYEREEWSNLKKSNSKRVCAEVKVKGLLDKSQEIALKKVRIALNILRLYTYPKSDDSLRRYFGIVGEVIPGDVRYILGFTEDKKWIFPIPEDFGYLAPFELDPERIETMKNNGFEIVNEILKRDKHNSFETRLLASIYWFGSGLNIGEIKAAEIQKPKDKEQKNTHKDFEYFNAGDRFLKFFVALESLLIFNENEPITNNIAERVAFLLGDKYEERKEIKKRMKDLYGVRSKIVHHGDVDITRYDLRDLTEVTQSVIINLILRKDELGIKSKEDLYEWFEKQKLS